jgi:hypothetical protein
MGAAVSVGAAVWSELREHRNRRHGEERQRRLAEEDAKFRLYVIHVADLRHEILSRLATSIEARSVHGGPDAAAAGWAAGALGTRIERIVFSVQ